MEALPIVLGVLALAGAGWSLTRSAPARLRTAVKECTETVAAIEAQWRSERAALQGYTEEIQSVLDSIERKRRQTAAAASRLNRANGIEQGEEPNIANMSAEQIREHFTRVARQRGLL